MPTTESFYAIVLRVFVFICFPCGSGQVVEVLVGAGILALLWGRSGGCWTLCAATGEELLVTLSLVYRGCGSGG